MKTSIFTLVDWRKQKEQKPSDYVGTEMWITKQFVYFLNAYTSTTHLDLLFRYLSSAKLIVKIGRVKNL